jgi:hypothetical protein
MKNLCRLSAVATFAVLALNCATYAQTPSLTVSPAVITNDYVGKIVLTISNVAPGQKVLVRRYADFNANGVVDSQDWLTEAFPVRDGSVALIGGVRNINVPGDEDGATNGQLRVELNYPGFNQVLDHIAGQYIFQVVDAQGVFAPVTAALSIAQKSYPQGVSGTVYDGGNGQPLAFVPVVLVPQQGNNGIGMFTDEAGNFSLSFVPGNYALLAFKNGSVANMSGVTLNSNSFVSVNLTNSAATQWLSGSVSDAGTAQGLPGIFVQAESTNNQMMIGFTDTNGVFNLPVSAGKWKVKVESDSGLAQGGYVTFQNYTLTAYTFSGSVSNLNLQFPKGTALVYGQVRDNLSNVVSNLEISGQDGSYTFDARGRTTTNGNYAVALFAGNWMVGPSSDDLVQNGLLGQSTNVAVTNGQALLANFQVQRPTAHLRGHVVDGNGNPVGNQSLVCFLTSGSNGPPLINLNAQTLGDGTFDIGVFGGSWNLGLECNSSAQRGLVVPYIIVNVTDGVDRNSLTLMAPFVTGYISGTIQDNHGNPVSANVYASLSLNGTNYSACGGNGGSSFLIPVFNGNWNVGISGDLTSLGFDNPPGQTVTVTGGTNFVSITLYPLGQTPPRLFSPYYNNGQFMFMVSGDVGQSYRVETTTNLNNPASWVTLRTNIAYGGVFSFVDTNATRVPPRYYRVVLVQ